jgi:hypothetical protein
MPPPAVGWDLEFESGSLQRRVTSEPESPPIGTVTFEQAVARDPGFLLRPSTKYLV